MVWGGVERGGCRAFGVDWVGVGWVVRLDWDGMGWDGIG